MLSYFTYRQRLPDLPLGWRYKFQFLLVKALWQQTTALQHHPTKSRWLTPHHITSVPSGYSAFSPLHPGKEAHTERVIKNQSECFEESKRNTRKRSQGPMAFCFRAPSLVLGFSVHMQKWTNSTETRWTTTARQDQDKHGHPYLSWNFLEGLVQPIQQWRHCRFILCLSFPSIQWYTRQQSVRSAVELQTNRSSLIKSICTILRFLIWKCTQSRYWKNFSYETSYKEIWPCHRTTDQSHQWWLFPLMEILSDYFHWWKSYHSFTLLVFPALVLPLGKYSILNTGHTLMSFLH